MTARKKLFGEMRPDEARAAGDEEPHAFAFRGVRTLHASRPMALRVGVPSHTVGRRTNGPHDLRIPRGSVGGRSSGLRPVNASVDPWPLPHRGRTIACMPVHVDPSLPVHPFTVDDVHEMLRVGILDPGSHVELLDGVLAQMSPQSTRHAHAIRRLTALAAPVAATAGLELSVQIPLDVGSDITLPEPDMAVAPVAGRDRYPSGAVLVVETGVASVRYDLGRKAEIYASAGVPEYWVLDVQQRRLVVHREPVDGCYTRVHALGEGETVVAVALDLAVPVAALL